jgi:predicted SAM-dependent methyltransferase
LKLDIGCGNSKQLGFVGLDLRRTSQVDIVADASMLPFRDNSIDHVFSSMLIEHFSHRVAKSVLKEWIRIVKKDGVVEIRCPDLRLRSLLLFLKPTWANIKNVYGEQDYSGNFHKCGFSYELLKSMLESLGVKKVKRVIKGYHGIPFIPDCLHVRGSKE